MQKYKVIGADRQSGEYSEVFVEASSEQEAGKRSGLMVQMVEAVAEPQPEPKRQATRQAPASTPAKIPVAWDGSDIAGMVLVVSGWLGVGLALLLVIGGLVRFREAATKAGWAGEESTLTLGAATGPAFTILFAGGVLLGLGTIVRVLRSGQRL